VAGIIGGGSLGSSSVVFVIKSGFLVSSDVFNEVIGALISDIRILFQENGVLGDLVGDFVIGILSIG